MTIPQRDTAETQRAARSRCDRCARAVHARFTCASPFLLVARGSSGEKKRRRNQGARIQYKVSRREVPFGRCTHEHTRHTRTKREPWQTFCREWQAYSWRRVARSTTIALPKTPGANVRIRMSPIPRGASGCSPRQGERRQETRDAKKGSMGLCEC